MPVEIVRVLVFITVPQLFHETGRGIAEMERTTHPAPAAHHQGFADGDIGRVLLGAMQDASCTARE
jgi:hypothetical protein